MRSREMVRHRYALEQLERRAMLSAVAPSGDDNDLAYDAVNHVTWVAYFDPTVQQLKARSRVDGGSWSAESILDQTPSTQVGKLPSIAVAPNGTVGVAYYDGTNADLKYVERNPSTGAWATPITIESAGRVGNYPSLAFNTKNNPFVSYWTDVTNGTDYLKLRWRDAGVWDPANMLTVDSGADVGRYSSLAINSSIGWAMSYVTGTGCKYAQQNGSGVTLQTVDATGAPAYDSLAFDGTNKPWVSYYRSTDTQVNVAVRGVSAWTTQSVFGGKGYYTNLWFEPGGADARLVFYEPGTVRARRFNYTSGAWQSNGDPSTVLFSGGGDEISAVRGAGGAITFTSVVSIQTANSPATYSKVLNLRDQADADLGKTWATVTQSPTQPAPNTSGPTVLMNGVMYMVNNTNGTRDDVWTSADNGVTWTNATAALSAGAAFGMRNDESLTVFNNELWVIGGRGGAGNTYLDDVWHSADGVTWTQAAGGAFPARSSPGVAVFNNRMYVIGGYYTDGSFGRRLDDVWSSADGVTWQADVASGAPFGKLDSMSVVAYSGRLWIIGGTVGGLSPVSNYVWSSADGQTWVQANSGNSSLPPRSSGSAFAFDNRLWLVGGRDFNFSPVDSIYYSLDGANWVLAGSLPSARATGGAFLLNNQMWLVGGNTSLGVTNDVLHSNP